MMRLICLILILTSFAVPVLADQHKPKEMFVAEQLLAQADEDLQESQQQTGLAGAAGLAAGAATRFIKRKKQGN
jgi:hypothetical protein